MMWEGAVDPEDQIDAAEAGRIMARAFHMMRAYRREIILSMVLIVAYTASTLAGPLLVRYAIDHGITAQEPGVLDRAVIAYVVVALSAYVLYRVQVMTIARAGEGFLRDIRRRLFDHLQRLSMTFYDRHKAGVLVSRMTSDIDSLAELMQFGLQQFVMNVLVLVLSIVVLGIVSWQLLLLCIVSLPLVVLASLKFRRDANRAYLDVRDRIGNTLSRLQEGLAGVRVIQAYGREDTEIRRFTDENRALYDAHMESVWVQSWYLPVIEIAGLGSTALVVGVGGHMAINQVVTIGTIAFFVLTLNNIYEPVQQLSQLFNTLQSAGAGLKKVFELLDTEIDVNERPGAVDLPASGAIVVDRVSFAYGDDAPVLHDVSLQIAHGERLALVGPTGAGKSTLAKLVARLYDPSEGTVWFGGVDLRDATMRSLRERIVVVPQEGFLFNGTIRENIRIARHTATDQEVESALREIGIHERFTSLPEGLDTEVRERGSRLSAGEKQLVSLARAALVDPSLLVLDEATSSLDPGTEVLVEDAMNRLMAGRTVIVIAHRLSTAERADRVGVVSGGRLVELDTHDELIAREGHYAKLFQTWQGGLSAA